MVFFIILTTRVLNSLNYNLLQIVCVFKFFGQHLHLIAIFSIGCGYCLLFGSVYYANSNNNGFVSKNNDNNNKYKRCDSQIAMLVHLELVNVTELPTNANILNYLRFKKVPIINL